MSEEKMLMNGWIIARVIERMTLSIVIIIVAIILVFAFWKSLQKIEFDIGSDKNKYSASIVFATPIFVLLILVGFSFVSFSHPLIVKNASNSNVNAKKCIDNTSSEDQFAFFGGGDKKDRSKMINNFHKSKEMINNYSLEKNLSSPELQSASALLKISIEDLIKQIYGSKLIAQCRNENNAESSETICKKIRGWLK